MTLGKNIGQQTDNSGGYAEVKTDLRRWLLTRIRGKIKVADLYAGDGVIWNDLKGDDRITYFASDTDQSKSAVGIVADAGNIAAAVADYDIIDLDSHSSPYRAIAALAEKHDAKSPQGIAITIGIVAPKRGDIDKAFKSIIPKADMPDRDIARALFFVPPTADFVEFAVRTIAKRIRAKTARYAYKIKGSLVIYAAFVR